MPEVRSAARNQPSMQRAAADLVEIAVPLLRDHFGLPPAQAHEAAESIGAALSQRAATTAAKRRSESRPPKAPDFIVCALDISTKVLRETLPVSESAAQDLAVLLVEALCVGMQRVTVCLPRAEYLLQEGIFELPGPATPPVSQRISAVQFVPWLIMLAANAIQAARPATPPSAARYAAKEVAYRICDQYNCCTVYVPLARSFELMRRNAAIRSAIASDSPLPGGPKKFTGARVGEIAFAHGLTLQNVYQVIRRARPARASASPAAESGDREIRATACTP